MRTTSLLIALLLCLTTGINAQFRVYQNGNIVFSLDDQLPDSVSLQNDTPTPLKLSKTTIGNTDNSTDWGDDHSDYITLSPGKKLTFEFDNYSSAEFTGNNWILIVSSMKATVKDLVDGNKIYLSLQPNNDGYCTTTSEGYVYDAANITSNYLEVASGYLWDYFREKINGAHVVMTVDHTNTGYILVNTTMTATDGTVLTQSYIQRVPSDDVYAHLTVNNCHFENLTASLSRSTATIEYYPTQLELSSVPTIFRLGDTNFHKGLTGKVRFKDGSTITLSEDELSYIQPNISTTGTKTITALYNKDYHGNPSNTVFASYDLPIYDISSIRLDVNKDVKYFFTPGATYFPLVKASATVYAVCSDNTEIPIDNSQITFSNVTTDGSVTATFSNLTASTTVDIATTQATQYGASDFSTLWYSVLSPDEQVKKGTTLTKTLQLRSDNAEAWHCPIIIIHNADNKEYALLRTDDYGWGDGYSTVTRESDWNFENFNSHLDGSVYTINIANNGTTIDVKMTVIDGAGVSHYQNFIGIDTTTTTQVDSDDVYVSFTTDSAYLLISD